MKTLLSLLGALGILIGSAVPASAEHKGVCGEGRDAYACGEINVGLDDDADATIEEVVQRNGGDPERDILNRDESIRAYTIDVPVGEEQDAVATYQADPAVDYAELNGAWGEAAGSTPLPDTASGLTSAQIGASLAIGLAMVSMAVILMARRGTAW